MVEVKSTGGTLWQGTGRAVNAGKDRTNRVVTAINAADVPHAIIGGNGVPSIEGGDWIWQAKTLSPKKLVVSKPTWFCDKDRVHLRGMITIGSIDQSGRTGTGG